MLELRDLICPLDCIVYPNNEFDHYLMKSPGWTLTAADKRTILYTTQNLNNLQFRDGKVPYEHLLNILDPINDTVIYTYGDAASAFLQKLLPTTVVKNLQRDGYVMPKQLPDSGCFRKHCARYCAKAKAIAIKDFVENHTNYEI